jgi:hypothetical protein
VDSPTPPDGHARETDPSLPSTRAHLPAAGGFSPKKGNSLVEAIYTALRPQRRVVRLPKLVESRHDSVKRTIERLAARAVIRLPPLVEVRNHLNQMVEEYQVGKRDSYVVVAQLSPEFTARLVDHWAELEREVAKPATPVPATPVAALSVDLCFAQAFFGTFKVAESSKVAIFRQIGESHGANTSYLPRLVVDEAPGLPGTSAPTAPLTDLLKARGARLSAREFFNCRLSSLAISNSTRARRLASVSPSVEASSLFGVSRRKALSSARTWSRRNLRARPSRTGTFTNSMSCANLCARSPVVMRRAGVSAPTPASYLF